MLKSYDGQDGKAHNQMRAVPRLVLQYRLLCSIETLLWKYDRSYTLDAADSARSENIFFTGDAFLIDIFITFV